MLLDRSPLPAAPLVPTLRRLQRGELDLLDYVARACDLLDELDPELCAVIPEPERRERLLREAEALLRRYPNPAYRPPLFGALVGVKDVFRADGFPTRAGSALPASLFEGPEAPAVTRLRRAGALLLGKTETTEFAWFEPGPTRNPRNPEHTPGGSSSGSAAAVAAGFCPLALGTQTIGSVIRPAAYCGVAGFVPTYGRVSTEGIVPFAPSVDHVGFFAQDVAGLRAAAAVLCVDGERWRSVPAAERRPAIGVPDGPYLEQAAPETREWFEERLAALEWAGFTVRSVPALENLARVRARHLRLCAVEMALTHAAWFLEHRRLYRPRTAELILQGLHAVHDDLERLLALPLEIPDSQFAAAEACLRTLRAAYTAAGEPGRPPSADDALLARVRAARDELFRRRRPGPGRSMLALRAELHAQMDAAGIDLWLCPATTGPAPRGLESTGDPAMSLPWTHAGMPAVTFPAGRSASGLPLGLQCVGRAGADEDLLAWAALLAAAV